MQPQKEDRIVLEILTPHGQVYREEVSYISVPAVTGSLGIYYGHAPLMCTLHCGVLEYIQGGERFTVAVTCGFMELKDNLALIMVHAAEKAEDIDEGRAEAALLRAKERLAHPAPDLDNKRAKAALQRALARLKVSRNRMHPHH